MKLSGILLLAGASILSLSFFTTEQQSSINLEINLPISLKSAIEIANEKVGTDSIYLSAFSSEYQPDEYLISDHLVLVNDLPTETDLFSKDIAFSVEPSGHLELVDFNLKGLEAQIVNKGAISLNNCLFQEGKDLTRLISNQGAFSITNGVFEGSSEGEIIRDAVFSHGARLIL